MNRTDEAEIAALKQFLQEEEERVGRDILAAIARDQVADSVASPTATVPARAIDPTARRAWARALNRMAELLKAAG